MYAVIFRAKINEIDDVYFETSKKMRELASTHYGCIEFTAVTEGSYEIAISYWKSMEDIEKWKENSDHILAQELGRTKWYKDYSVQIVEVVSEYSKREKLNDQKSDNGI